MPKNLNYTRTRQINYYFFSSIPSLIRLLLKTLNKTNVLNIPPVLLINLKLLPLDLINAKLGIT
jgi:hypothetical protein